MTKCTISIPSPIAIGYILLLGMAFLLPVRHSDAQPYDMKILGRAEKKSNSNSLSGVEVKAKAGGSTVESATTSSNGKYSMDLEIGKKYTIEFHKSGYASKKVIVNTSNIPLEDQKIAEEEGGFEMAVNMTLFEKVKGMDESVLDKPIGKARYNEEKVKMEWNFSYTSKVKKELKKERKNAIRELEAKKKKYRKLMEKGGQAMEDRSYGQARDHYKEAAGIFPDKKKPKKKAEEAKKKLAEQKKKQERYEKLISAADKKFDEEAYKAAKSKYQKALEVFSDKEHPSERLDKIEGIIEQQKEKKQEYQKRIDEADQAFEDEAFEKAKTKYKEALDIFPDRSHPNDRLKTVKKRLKEKEKFNALVSEADQAFENEAYEKARKKYQEALGLWGDASHPKKRTEKIDQILKEKKEKQEKYDRLIGEADQAFEEKELEKARSKYKKAGAVFPEKEYPKKKLSEVKKLLGKQKEKKEKYKQVVDEADRFFGNEKYKKAKGKYQEALDIFSDKQYPKDRIAKAEKAIEKRKEKEKKRKRYKALINKADERLKNDKLKKARSKYEKALEVFPEKQYPQDQLKKVKERIADRKESKKKEQRYKERIASADEKFEAGEYKAAKKAYEEALNIFPNKSHPKKRVDLCEKKLAAAKEKKKKKGRYKELITKADEAFKGEQYKKARRNYKDALDIFPERSHPQSRLDEIKKRLAAQKEKGKKKERYQKTIKTADELFNKEQYGAAKKKYKAALELFPGKEHPQERIDKVNGILARKKKEERYQAAIQKADRHFAEQEWKKARDQYKKALGIFSDKTYPQKRLEKCKKHVAEQKKESEKDKRFDRLVSSGDKHFDQADYEKAIQKYRDALAIRSKAEHPQKRINEAERLIEKRKRKKEKKERYERLIADGDAAYDKEAYEKALTNYKKASGLMPGKSYPKERIDKIEKRLKESSEKAETEKAEKDKQREAEYQTLIDRADQRFQAEKYDAAKKDYRAALKIKPDEYHPKKRIEKIELILKKQKKNRGDRSGRTAQNNKKDQKEEDDEPYYGERIDDTEDVNFEKDMEELREEERRARQKQLKKEKERIAGSEEKRRKSAGEERRKRMEAIKEKEDARDQVRNKGKERYAEQTQELSEKKGEVKEWRNEYREEEKTSREVEKKYVNNLKEEHQKRIREQQEKFDKQTERMKKQKKEWVSERHERAEKGAKKRTERKKRIQARKAEQKEKNEAHQAAYEERVDQVREQKEERRKAHKDRVEEEQTSRQVEQKYVSNLKEEHQKKIREKQQAFDKKADRLTARKKELKEAHAERIDESATAREVEKKYVENLKEKRKEKLVEKQKAHDKRVEAVKERKKERKADHNERVRSHGEEIRKEKKAVREMKKELREKKTEQKEKHDERVEERKAQKDKIREWERDKRKEDDKLRSEEMGEIKDRKKGVQEFKESHATKKEENQEALRELKADHREEREAMRKEEMEELRGMNRDSVDLYKGRSDREDRPVKSELAEKYPQGVSEEKYKQGNKRIVRRIVVKGDRADDYHKSISKSGTYYFKNGRSISKEKWVRETENVETESD